MHDLHYMNISLYAALDIRVGWQKTKEDNIKSRFQCKTASLNIDDDT